MAKIFTQCPSCRSHKLKITHIHCDDCHTQFSGEFAIPALIKLSAEDLQFILDFVKCSGSLKEMAIKQKVSYPTLRNKLNSLIDTLHSLEQSIESSKIEILQKLEQGNISAADAAKLLLAL